MENKMCVSELNKFLSEKKATSHDKVTMQRVLKMELISLMHVKPIIQSDIKYS